MEEPLDVRTYYHCVLPFFERELADRGDGVFWAWAASEPPGCRVLEIGAGTGRATAFLARSAGSVVAYDLSPELLAVARRKLAPLPHVRLLAADAREPPLRGRFDLVVAVDDPFVHLLADADRDRALQAAAALLAPAGRLILDAAWLSPARRRAAGTVAGLLVERTGHRGLQVREHWHCNPHSRLCTARFEYRLEGNVPAAATFSARLWSVAELHRRCRAAGLRVTHLWGDYDRAPWRRATSPRLIAEARRA